MSVQSDVKKALDALGADIAALQSQCASLSSQISGIKSGIDSFGAGWIRFSDGTQVCWASLVDCNIETKFSFPKPFISIPTVTVGGEGKNEENYVHAILTRLVTTSGGSIKNLYNNSRYRTERSNYIAIGRWK